jgi:hypothetical protein
MNVNGTKSDGQTDGEARQEREGGVSHIIKKYNDIDVSHSAAATLSASQEAQGEQDITSEGGLTVANVREKHLIWIATSEGD